MEGKLKEGIVRTAEKLMSIKYPEFSVHGYTRKA